MSYLNWILYSGVFDVLAYTDNDVEVPFTWIESDPKLIVNPQMVKLHSFDTKVVTYIIHPENLLWTCLFADSNVPYLFRYTRLIP